MTPVCKLKLGWALVVDQDGCPLLLGPDRRPAPLFSVSEQPRTCRLLRDRLERWLATAERTYLIDDPILLAVRWSRDRLTEYLAVTEASCVAAA